MMCTCDLKDNDRVANNFERKGSARLSGWFFREKPYNRKPEWLTNEQWKQLQAYWRTPEFIAKFELVKDAHASQNGLSLHIVGARTQGHVARKKEENNDVVIDYIDNVIEGNNIAQQEDESIYMLNDGLMEHQKEHGEKTQGDNHIYVLQEQQQLDSPSTGGNHGERTRGDKNIFVSQEQQQFLPNRAREFMAYRMNAIMLQSLPAAENESFRQLFVVSRSSPILDFSNRLEVTEQISKFGVKCMPPLNIRSQTRRRGSRIAFALDTGRIPSSDDQDGLNGDGRDLGGTRLGRIVGAGGRQLLEKLNSARKNFPMKVFLLLLGFYTANALATILGQTGDWDVLVAGVVVAAIEGIGMLMYKKPPSLPSRRLQSLVSMVNYWKAGVILGLFVDAFKLGS
ncbi:hypothetical protein K7X08_022201 [Anisodus acutangulus]|uniref:Ycf20-like protein n=1 Tax=Anisodus acutangulus TaxID=402998 RepID=A0A9Q1QU31_9SOLA|nr:hypothetical protein K7X08_022201 [Anisodus acutangulus]